MLLFGLLFLPMVLSIRQTMEVRNGATTIYDTLINFHLIGKENNVADLSNLGLKAIEERAFDHYRSYFKSLNLSNNSLISIPEKVFANFTELENLDLANNHLVSGKFYADLSRLKTLNISNNLMNKFEAGHFFGLPKFTDIYTQGIQFTSINSSMFENPSTIKSPKPNPIFEILRWRWALFDHDRPNNFPNFNRSVRINACMKYYGHLETVEAFEKDKVCFDREVVAIVRLDALDIKTVKKGWFRLQDQNVYGVGFYNNEITEITSELLNDLPEWIHEVNLGKNKIEKISRGVMVNKNPIDDFYLTDNRISEIENGAFENLNLTNKLNIDHNLLTNTKFLDSLPSSVGEVTLEYNKISEISPGNFSKFTNFRILSLVGNNITEIKSQTLNDFSSLKVLKLSKVNLTKIEPGAFQDLKNLETLDISENQISSLQKGIFDGLDSLTRLLLNSNKLKEIPNNIFNAMPNSLRILALSNNEIECLKTGTFGNAPTLMLDLYENKISKIEKGAINLPSLKALVLNNNLLNDVEGLCDGLDNLGSLYLAFNNITTIKRGFAKNLGNLHNMDLSYNPIRALENGALFGLPDGTGIELNGVPVEIIQGGLFEDV